MNIFLKHNSGFKWQTKNTISFKGYFYVDDLFYEKDNALNYLLNIKCFKQFLKKVTGVFTILKKDNNSLIIINDITRSFPIFYAKNKKEYFFSDDIYFLQTQLETIEFDPFSEIELKASNHVYGTKTLVKNVYQTQSSEYLIFDNNELKEQTFYYNYSIKKESNSSLVELKEEAISSIENSFKRLVKSLDQKTIVIPLSGGFDSRLIATMLKKHQHKNVICYTYGRKDSFEIKNSKRTATALGFKWYFIEYNAALIDNYLHSDDFKEFSKFSGKLSSMPNLQEYFAVKYLTEQQLIPTNAVFISGYAGDLLGGSQYLKVIPKKLKHNDIVDLIISKKIINSSISVGHKKELKKNIHQGLLSFDANYLDKKPASVFEDFDIKEKIAKYIFNSASFYNFFGYEFRFPFWDKEVLDFFKKVPAELKLMKTFFDDVLINEYFKKYNVYFESELQPTELKIKTQKIKDIIKPFLPNFIKKKILQKNDWNNYQPITNQMLLAMKKNDLKVARKYKDYNEIITQWYIYNSKNMIK